MAGISLIDIRKTFGAATILDNVSFDVRDGEFLSILGPSGCGKSTLLKLIAGLDFADSGEIRIGERSMNGVDPSRRDVAMVFQSYALYPHLKAGANIAVPLEMRRLNALQRFPLLGRLLPGTGRIRAAIRDDVAATAGKVRLTNLLDRLPKQLSGGERQRVAIARALVRQPAVMLMDEPLSNLDAQLRVAMRSELSELHRRTGLTIVFVTHDQSEAMSISNRVAVMMHGKLRQIASPRELYDRPDDLTVARFVGDIPINVLPAGPAANGALDVCDATMRFDGVPAGASELQVGLRPEWLQLTDAGAGGSWQGRITDIEYLGSEAVVRLTLEAGAVLTMRWDSDWAPPILGQVQAVRAKPGRGLLFDNGGRRIAEASARPALAVPA